MNKSLAWTQRMVWQHAFSLVLLLLAQGVQAMTVMADIKSGQLRWVSAQSSFDGGGVFQDSCRAKLF